MISRNFWYARHDFPPPGDKLLIVPDDKNIHPGWGGYFYGTPDTIRTCDLQSRSFQAHPDKMLCFQWLYGFYRQHLFFLNFLKTIENTG